MRGLAVWTFLLSVLLSLGGCAVPAVKQTSALAPIPVAKNSEAKSVQFKKIVIDLKPGTETGMFMSGMACEIRTTMTWKGSEHADVGDKRFTDTFRDELQKANYQVVGDTDALFEDPATWQAEYLVAGSISGMQLNICRFGSGYKGGAYLQVDWQVYSRLDRTVVYRKTTDGSYNRNDTTDDEESIMLSAFSQATDNLLADQKFHDLIAASQPVANQSKDSLLIIPAVKPFTTALADHSNMVRASVVTVFAGDGSGTGLVLGSGYALTDAHVVGDAKFVKVKLVTGREMLGEVVRKNAPRDVALLKLEDETLPGLPLRSTEANVGEDVYALGSSLGTFESTLSKGVLSAYREHDGIRYIQSDVTVLPGNSGGPLLDHSGNVIGLTEMGIEISGAPAGVNFFNPILDCLTALNVQVAPAKK